MPRKTQEPAVYRIMCTDLASGRPVYLREVSWIGHHMTYQKDEAGLFTLKKAKELARLDRRFLIEPNFAETT